MLDTPGVLWPKFEDEKVALNLSYIGSIKDEILQTIEIALSLLAYLYDSYKYNLMERYKLTDSDIETIKSEDENEEIYNLMKLIGKKRGAVVSGGDINEEKTANIILNDFRSGKLGRITLEKVYEK